MESSLMSDMDTIDGIIRDPIDDDALRGRRPANDHDHNGRPARYTRRRLSDKILIAFHHACDQGDIEVSVSLLEVLEFITKRTRSLRVRDHRSQKSLVAAHERLWALRHPELPEC
jgi:hypothetical protein